MEAEKKVSITRKVANGLLVFPWLLMLFQQLHEAVWGVFWVTLLPISIALIVLQYRIKSMLKKLRKQQQLFDDFKVLAGVIGAIIGTIFYAATYVVLG